MKSDWDALGESQKIENLISRIRFWATCHSMTPDEIELAMNIGLNATLMIRASAMTRPTQEAA